jgi:heptaprenyl diphosphate synthase
MGILFALAIALSILESIITPLLGLMPAVKIGLANVVVMFALLYLGRGEALVLVLLKALFGFLTRGAIAGFLSLCGGGVSLAVLCILLALPRFFYGCLFSVCGALAHNLGQLAGAAFVLSSSLIWSYAPVLLVSGCVVGCITWLILKRILRAFPNMKAQKNIKK